ncbi:MAG: ABC transporter permease [Negativicutes bacterium]
MNEWDRGLRLFRYALRVMGNHRWRSAMAMIGVAIGAAAVIALLAIGEGSRRDIMRRIDSMGTNLIIVSAVKAPNAMKKDAAAIVSTLTPADAAALRERVPGLKQVVESHARKLLLKAADETANTNVVGAPPDIVKLKGLAVARGEFFGEEDESAARRVVVLGRTVANKLFAGQGVGEKLRINGVMFQVVGILAEKGPDVNGQDQDDIVYVPLSTAMKKIFNVTYLTQIYLQVGAASEMDSQVTKVQNVLRERHRIAQAATPDFSVLNQSELLKTRQEVQGTFRLLLLSIAGISLLLGGIGVLSVMLLTVRERTWEIGVRRAIGARRRDIRTQFLLEATVLGGMGGILGLVCGVIAAIAAGFWLKWPIAFQPMGLLGPMLYAFAIGLIFGLYPAHKAAALDPMAALRTA